MRFQNEAPNVKFSQQNVNVWKKHLQGAGASQNFQKVASGHWCDWFLIPGSELYGFSKKSNSCKSTKVLNFKHFWKN